MTLPPALTWYSTVTYWHHLSSMAFFDRRWPPPQARFLADTGVLVESLGGGEGRGEGSIT